MKTAFCPSCQTEVEVAEGRCWECCRILGYPVVGEGGTESGGFALVSTCINPPSPTAGVVVLRDAPVVAAGASLNPATKGRKA